MTRTALVTTTCDNCGGTWTQNEKWSSELPSLSYPSASALDAVNFIETSRRDYCSLCVEAVEGAISAALAVRKMAVRA